MHLRRQFIIDSLLIGFFGLCLSGCCLVTTPAKVALKTGATAVSLAADVV